MNLYESTQTLSLNRRKTMWNLSLFKKDPTFEDHLEVVTKQKNDMIESAQKLDQSLVKMHGATQALGIIMKYIDNKDYSKQKAMIKSLDLDADYEENILKKIDEIKPQTKATLDPLKKDVAKLQANMILAKEKSSAQILIIDSQRRAIESGKLNSEEMKRLQAAGYSNTEEIKRLVTQAESMNSVTKNTVLDIKGQTDSIEILEAGDGDSNWDDILADFKPKDASPTGSAA